MFVFYLIAKGSLQESIYNNLTTMVVSRSNNIETYLEMLETSVGQLSKSITLEDFLKINGKENPQQEEAFERMTKRLKRTKEVNPEIAEFLLLDVTGKVVASSNESSVGLDKSTDSIFLGGQKETYIKDAYYLEGDKKPLMAVSAPLLDSQTGELLGVLAARVRLNDLNSIVTEKTGMGDTGEIFIVNKYGYMVTPSRLKEETVLRQKVDTEDVRIACLHKGREHPLSADKRIDVFPDYRGVQVLGAHEYIPRMQWAVLAEIDAKEAFAPLAKLRLIFLIILFIVPIAAWLLGIFLAQLITGPLHKLHKGSEIIGCGNLDYKIGTDAKDEIGQLSRAFDTMVENLKKTTTSIDNLNKEIAERKQAEEALKKARAFTESTLNSITDIFYSFDLSGKFLNWNKTFSRISGYSDQELSLKKPTDFFSGEDIQHIAEAVERIYKDGTAKTGANFVIKDGRQIPYEFTGSILKDSKGDIVGFSGTGRDLTERKRAEGALIETMKVKSDFTSTVSHELRTPLTAIKEGIAIVLDGTAGVINAEQKDFLSLAKRNVDRLARLINDVLDFQKLDAHKMVFNIEENDINELIREVHNTMAPLTDKKGLGFSLQLGEGLPRVKFDRDRIVQVLTNLVSNAIKFTQNGSIVIASSRGDNAIQVSVKDTGPGVKEEDMGKLFQQFRQLEKITERKTGGTGLGLAISKEIIEKHKGRIWAESEFGKGTTFCFIIPVKIKDKVLVIDDDRAMLDVIKNFLEKKGHDVTCSEKGLDAVEIISRDKPDLVILDMKLKDISGFEIIGRLRSNKDTLRTPIIAMSGYIEELIKIEDRQEELAFVSIAKPFDLEDLLSIARKLLQQRF